MTKKMKDELLEAVYEDLSYGDALEIAYEAIKNEILTQDDDELKERYIEVFGEEEYYEEMREENE